MSYTRRLAEWLAQHQPAVVDRSVASQILVDLAPITESTLRRLLRAGRWPLAPDVEGVRQDSIDNLDRTLRALADQYELDPAPSREAVLLARRHAEWNLRRAPDDPLRQEAMLWIGTWLENPSVFPAWVRLRRQRLELS